MILFSKCNGSGRDGNVHDRKVACGTFAGHSHASLCTVIDRISVAGKTFRYGEHGPVGPCGGKKLIIASSKKETAALAA